MKQNHRPSEPQPPHAAPRAPAAELPSAEKHDAGQGLGDLMFDNNAFHDAMYDNLPYPPQPPRAAATADSARGNCNAEEACPAGLQARFDRYQANAGLWH